jgi:phage terminase large subunit-like protein
MCQTISQKLNKKNYSRRGLRLHLIGKPQRFATVVSVPYNGMRRLINGESVYARSKRKLIGRSTIRQFRKAWIIEQVLNETLALFSSLDLKSFARSFKRNAVSFRPALLILYLALTYFFLGNLMLAPSTGYSMNSINLPTESYEKLAESADVVLAKRNPSDFAEYILTDESGQPIQNGAIHAKAHSHVLANKFALVEFPREHGKTEQFAISKPIHLLGKNPNLRIKIVCANDSLAGIRVQAISEHLLNNSKVKLVYPNLKPAKGKAWTMHQLFIDRNIISKDPSVEAYGILSSSTGGRADILIFDDVCDLRNTITQPKLRDSVKAAFYNQWIPLLSPDGTIIYIYTVWHQDDLSHELKRNSEYSVFKKVVDSNLNPVWPQRWPKVKLQERLRQMGQRAFARAFQGQAMSDDEAIFGNIDNCIALKMSYGDIYPEWPRYSGLDLAISDKPGADYTVLFTIAVDKDGKRWPVEIIRGRYSSVQTAKLVIDSYRAHKQRIIMVENNAYQAAFLEWINQVGGAGLPLRAYTTGKQKMDENIGLPSLAAEIDRGAWVIPMQSNQYPDGLHPADCSCNICEWLNEMRSYPVATHDDTVMACFFAREATMNRDAPGFVS